MFEPVSKRLIPLLSAVLCLYTLTEVNFPRLRPQSQLALFVMLGLVLGFLGTPARPVNAGGTAGSPAWAIWPWPSPASRLAVTWC